MTTEFGAKLRELREAKGIMPATIDEYLGIMRGSCTNWENGYSMPEEELIEDLAAYFRVPMKELNMVNPLTQEKSAAKMKIIVQSPVGEEINMTDLAAKLPEGTEKVYIRVDQNKLYWVGKNGETGDVDIW